MKKQVSELGIAPKSEALENFITIYNEDTNVLHRKGYIDLYIASEKQIRSSVSVKWKRRYVK